MRTTTAFLVAALLALPGLVQAQSAAVQQKFKLKPGAVGTTCLGCHATFADVLKKPFVHTPVKSKDCTGCHNPHATDHARVLKEEIPRLCLNCHEERMKAQKSSVHTAAGNAVCSTCHDPHSTDAPNLVRTQPESTAKDQTAMGKKSSVTQQ